MTKETIETIVSGPKCPHRIVEQFDKVSFDMVRLLEDVLKCFFDVIDSQFVI